MNGIGQAIQAAEHHITDIIRNAAAQANECVARAETRRAVPSTPRVAEAKT